MKRIILSFLSFFIIVLTLNFISCSKSDDSSSPTPENIQIGELIVEPNSIIVNQANQMVIRLNVPFGVKLTDSVVVLAKVDNNNNQLAKLGELFDNGLLSNADEIKGDNIYTGKVNVLETSPGSVRLMAFAKVTDKQGMSAAFQLDVYSDLTPAMINQVLNLHNSSATQLNTYLGGNVNNLATASEQLKTWVQSQPGVASVEKSGSTSMLINYTNGLKGGIVITVNDGTGNNITRGGLAIDDKPRNSTPTLPLSKQTVGQTFSNFNLTNPYFKTAAIPANRVGNRNVLIYAPFEDAFAPWNEADEIIARLNQASCKGFSITHLSNTAANVEALMNLSNYGFIVLATHGSQGKQFATGEYFDTNTTNYKTKYKALLQAGKLAVWYQVVVGSSGTVVNRKNIYAVNASFISSLAGTLPNSIVLNNSCESTMNADLQNAFIGKGAKTYYGYTKVVNSDFCVTIADSLAKRLAKDNLTSGQSFFAATDPHSPFAVWQIKGANDMLFLTDLTNGDFEVGTLEGWTKSGDGRVISQLGSQSPAQGNYMGIISSGLGYTTATGSIYQCVAVPSNATKMTLKWNFFSEEFLEYIGSIYQDYFRISIKKADGTEVEIYKRTVDGFASQFGASKTSPGQLIKVSPNVVFDKGDVYMTGWQTSEFDVTAYRGSTIVITFAIGDVGDSIFDSACLLDDIKVL